MAIGCEDCTLQAAAVVARRGPAGAHVGDGALNTTLDGRTAGGGDSVPERRTAVWRGLTNSELARGNPAMAAVPAMEVPVIDGPAGDGPVRDDPDSMGCPPGYAPRCAPATPVNPGPLGTAEASPATAFEEPAGSAPVSGAPATRVPGLRADIGVLAVTSPVRRLVPAPLPASRRSCTLGDCSTVCATGICGPGLGERRRPAVGGDPGGGHHIPAKAICLRVQCLAAADRH